MRDGREVEQVVQVVQVVGSGATRAKTGTKGECIVLYRARRSTSATRSRVDELRQLTRPPKAIRVWAHPSREAVPLNLRSMLPCFLSSLACFPFPHLPIHPPSTMPSVEEVFDDDTDFPLPDTPSQGPGGSYLRNTGTQGALLEEITDDDVDAVADAAGTYDMDMDRVAEQGRGFGDNVGRPKAAPSSSQTLAPISSSSSDLRPTGDRMPQQGPMGGIMGDFLEMQKAEEARMKKLEQQLGSGMIMKDQQEFKACVKAVVCVYRLDILTPPLLVSWNTLYPLYFDAKLSVNQGRRVPRSKALWWPQSLHIAKACSALGLQCVHEVSSTGTDRVSPHSTYFMQSHASADRKNASGGLA
jgi:signal recognition particle subunit SEC65